PSTGIITGTPVAPGTLSFTLTVKDSTPGGGLSASASRSIVVSPRLGITTTSLPAAVAGSAYTAVLSAAGGTKPYSWSATGLPAGLGINASGNITGTPTAGGTSIVSVTLKDSTVPPQTAIAKINLRVIAPPSIKPDSLPGGAVGVAYASQLSATGGTPP